MPADPGEALGRLVAALLRVVERAGSGADGAPVLIVVDDLHLAGPSTVEWLRFAARRSQRLRLVLASRPTPVPVPDGARRIELGPLDLAAAGQLVEVRTGAPVDAARLEALWARSGGNPLLLHALATASADATVPAGVREVVDGLLESFGGAAATVRAAAERNAAAAQTVDPAAPAEPEIQGRLDLVDIALLSGEVDRAARLLSQVELQPLDSGTMVWHQRERHGLLTARIALAAGDRAGAAGAATEVCASAGRARQHPARAGGPAARGLRGRRCRQHPRRRRRAGRSG
ncbi:MAG: hypothetical protein DLM61_26705 [Pseudonocardiales bacterium]|nr:MAG: hypothetical protein DLM61_26705 [Pseudonocardiales bacterium]